MCVGTHVLSPPTLLPPHYCTVCCLLDHCVTVSPTGYWRTNEETRYPFTHNWWWLPQWPQSIKTTKRRLSSPSIETVSSRALTTVLTKLFLLSPHVFYLRLCQRGCLWQQVEDKEHTSESFLHTVALVAHENTHVGKCPPTSCGLRAISTVQKHYFVQNLSGECYLP